MSARATAAVPNVALATVYAAILARCRSESADPVAAHRATIIERVFDVTSSMPKSPLHSRSEPCRLQLSRGRTR